MEFTSSFADGNAANQDHVAKMLGASLTAVMEINGNGAVHSDFYLGDVKLKEVNHYFLNNMARLGPYFTFCFYFPFNSRCECYDYLFDIAVQMKQHGLDPSKHPTGENGIL